MRKNWENAAKAETAEVAEAGQARELLQAHAAAERVRQQEVTKAGQAHERQQAEAAAERVRQNASRAEQACAASPFRLHDLKLTFWLIDTRKPARMWPRRGPWNEYALSSRERKIFQQLPLAARLIYPPSRA